MDRISLEEFAREQATDPFCKETLARIHKKETTSFKEDEKSGLIVRSVRGSNQILVPETLRPRLLALAHHSLPAAHPGGRKMYMTLRTTFYWPSMVVDVYTTVRNCKSCAMERVRARFRHTKLKLFPASAPLEDVAMDLLGELTTTPRGNKNILVITDRFSKLVRVAAMSTTRAIDVAKVFMRIWVSPTDL